MKTELSAAKALAGLIRKEIFPNRFTHPNIFIAKLTAHTGVSWSEAKDCLAFCEEQKILRTEDNGQIRML